MRVQLREVERDESPLQLAMVSNGGCRATGGTHVARHENRHISTGGEERSQQRRLKFVLDDIPQRESLANYLLNCLAQRSFGSGQVRFPPTPSVYIFCSE